MEAYLVTRAKAKGVDVGQLVNELLKKDIELIEAVRWPESGPDLGADVGARAARRGS